MCVMLSDLTAVISPQQIFITFTCVRFNMLTYLVYVHVVVNCDCTGIVIITLSNIVNIIFTFTIYKYTR